MSRFAPKNPKRTAAIIGGGVVLAAIIGWLSWPLMSGWAANRAAQYAADAAGQHNSQLAIGEYRLAQALDPGNPAYGLSLADLYVARNQPQEAVRALGNSPEERIRRAELLARQGGSTQAISAIQGLPGSAAAIERSRIYLEQGDGSAALAAVTPATTDAERQQLALAQQASNGQGNRLQLAQTLYATGLYRSCQRVLTMTPDSPTKYLLLANALLAISPNDHSRLQTAQGAAKSGLKLAPANLALHQLLRDIDQALGDSTDAAQQQQLVESLRSGHI